jgi:predicted nucleic acid-binding protein
MVILDTNVISETMSPVPSSVVLAWLSKTPKNGSFFLTSITVAEILYGIELLPAGKHHAKLLAEAEAMIGQDFAGRILPFDEQAARLFPIIAADRRGQGHPIADFDAQVAAIARSHGATLATRNTADFQGCGVRLINPWQHNSKS